MVYLDREILWLIAGTDKRCQVMTCFSCFSRKNGASSDNRTIEGDEGTHFGNFSYRFIYFLFLFFFLGDLISFFLHILNLSVDKAWYSYVRFQCRLNGQKIPAIRYVALFHDMVKELLNFLGFNWSSHLLLTLEGLVFSALVDAIFFKVSLWFLNQCQYNLCTALFSSF